MSEHTDPSLNRRTVRLALRKAREDRGMTQSDAGQTLEWSLSKIIRIEQGASSISVTDLRALLAVYGLTDPERAAELEEAARYSRNQSWWAPFNDVVSPGFNRYLGYESAAISIHGYHSSRLPEHVQTEDYAEALLDEGLNLNVDQRRIELHAARQKRVLGENGPRVAMVLDEAALRRQVGGPAVMVDQLKFLKELATREKADLRALPFMSGVYSSLDDSFVLLGFKDDDDALCLTDPEGTFAVRDGHKPLARYQTCFANLHSKTLSRTDTLTLIDDLTETFRVLLERQ
ncbi:helix-turn-helix transcriptional regulator [Streptomyces sp. NPDC006290]|uniref:helix-turn-helix domain-containing protein n=1 Tax=Streptomyces sp. NPDC006290 TaxID=3156745 RepID=UPI0033BA460E